MTVVSERCKSLQATNIIIAFFPFFKACSELLTDDQIIQLSLEIGHWNGSFMCMCMYSGDRSESAWTVCRDWLPASRHTSCHPQGHKLQV